MNLQGFTTYLQDRGLGDRSVIEYTKAVERAYRLADPVLAITRIKHGASKILVISALRRYAEYRNDTDLKARIAALPKIKHRDQTKTEKTRFTDAEYDRIASLIHKVARTTAESFALKAIISTGARCADICNGVTHEVMKQAEFQPVMWIKTKGSKKRAILCEQLYLPMKAILTSGKRWTHLYDLLCGTRHKRATSKAGCKVVSTRFAVLCREAGVSKPWNIHRARHTLASRLYVATRDPIAVQTFFGWADLKTTQKYIHVDKLQDMATNLGAGVIPKV